MESSVVIAPIVAALETASAPLSFKTVWLMVMERNNGINTPVVDKINLL